jgi:hypothetical protein
LPSERCVNAPEVGTRPQVRVRIGRCTAEECKNHWHRRLLCARREQPRGSRASE